MLAQGEHLDLKRLHRVIAQRAADARRPAFVRSAQFELTARLSSSSASFACELAAFRCHLADRATAWCS
jgi:hypothetical protein